MVCRPQGSHDSESLERNPFLISPRFPQFHIESPTVKANFDFLVDQKLFRREAAKLGMNFCSRPQKLIIDTNDFPDGLVRLLIYTEDQLDPRVPMNPPNLLAFQLLSGAVGKRSAAYLPTWKGPVLVIK